MRAVVQRVSRGSVSVENSVVGKIKNGYVVLLGVGKDDTIEDCRYMVEKIINLRLFEDHQGKINLSIKEVGGEILAVSQFTLYADCRKGRRPGFSDAAPPQKAEELYNVFVEGLKEYGINVQTGKFQAHMLVEIINDGPVTILLDSKKNF